MFWADDHEKKDEENPTFLTMAFFGAVAATSGQRCVWMRSRSSRETDFIQNFWMSRRSVDSIRQHPFTELSTTHQAGNRCRLAFAVLTDSGVSRCLSPSTDNFHQRHLPFLWCRSQQLRLLQNCDACRTTVTQKWIWLSRLRSHYKAPAS